MKNLFWQIQRYVGLILAPIFALILTTGLILAVGDFIAPNYSQQAWGNQAPQVLRTVETLNQQGVQAASIYMDANDPNLLW
ncbi:MAG: hypothetical protein IJV56_05080, partial [Neisseriaceae bacterium]|nr:hypothetical protein [Neisseriaceae bacterium]